MHLLEIHLYHIFFSQEKELLKKKQEEIQEAERLKQSKVIVTFDLVGRKVLALSNDLISTYTFFFLIRCMTMQQKGDILLIDFQICHFAWPFQLH